MRKIAYTDNLGDIKKLMIYKDDFGVYLFGYNCLQDTSSIFDNFYDTIDNAEEYCQDEYNIYNNDWIEISEPLNNCQHDFIMPVKVKGKDIGKPQWGQYLVLTDDKWIEYIDSYKCLDFGGMTGNERLWVSGLLNEFDKAKTNNKEKAKKILKALGFDIVSINEIIE